MTEKSIIRPRARTKDNEENLQRFSPIIIEKYLRVVDIQLSIALPKLLLAGFYKAFSHHHFVVNPFSNGYVPFPSNQSKKS